MNITVTTQTGSIPVAFPPGTSPGDQVNMVAAVSALAKLSNEQRRIVVNALGGVR